MQAILQLQQPQLDVSRCSESGSTQQNMLDNTFKDILLAVCGTSPVLPGRLGLSITIKTSDVQLLEVRPNNVVPDLPADSRQEVHIKGMTIANRSLGI